MRRLALLPLLTLLLACQDNPVQPPAADDAADLQPAFSAAQGDRSEWEVILTVDLSGGYNWVPCINDGAGGWGTFYMVYTVLQKEVVTPSGNVNRIQKITYTSPNPSLHALPWLDADSGEIWWYTKEVQPGHLHTKKKDGQTYGVWQETGIWENADGDRLMLKGHFKYLFYDYQGPLDVFDPGPDEVGKYVFEVKCLG